MTPQYASPEQIRGDSLTIAPHLGLGADPSSACPHHRSWRRPVAGRIALDRLQARLLPACARALAPLSSLFLDGLAPCTPPAASPSSAISRPLAEECAFDAALTRVAPARLVRLRPAAVRRTSAVLAYLARYTHRVAISNSPADRARRRLASPSNGRTSVQRPRPAQDHDARRRRVHPSLSLHVLPSGFHRIRHYGLFAGTVRARNIERVRQWLAAPEASPAETDCDFEDRNTEGPSPGHHSSASVNGL